MKKNSQRIKNVGVIPNQSADWCGNPPDRSENHRKLSKNLRGLPRQCAHRPTMTGFLTARKNLPVLLCLILSMLCGCSSAPVPEPGPVFDPSTIQVAASTDQVQENTVLSHEETFQNADSSVTFYVDINQKLSMEAQPILEAKPRILTAQDAKDVIEVFFPDGKCYERHPKYTSPETNWTKNRLEKNLQRWRSYTYEDLEQIYGGIGNAPVAMSENGDDIPFMDYWQQNLSYFEDLLEKTPEEDMRTPSLWHMFKETEYLVEPEEAERMDLSQDNDCIQANVEVGDDHYYYVVRSGMENGRPHSLISLGFSTPGSPTEIDWQIFLNEVKSLPRPTQEQLDMAIEWAQSYLDKLPLGQWVLTDALPSDSDGTIYVRGYAAQLPEPELVMETSYVSALPEITFRFHPDGTILNFSVRGCLAELVTHTDNAAQLPMDTLLETCLNHLKTGKTMAYGASEEELRQFQIGIGEDVTCEVSISRVVYGFTAMNTPEGGICYVPSLCLMGKPSFIGKDSGTIYTLQDVTLIPTGEIAIAAVNAIDGTIVQ